MSFDKIRILLYRYYLTVAYTSFTNEKRYKGVVAWTDIFHVMRIA